MARLGKAATVLTVSVGALLLFVPSLPASTRTTGKQSFHGGLVVSNASGQRKVLGTVVATSGVFNGVGHIVERPNRPGDSNQVSRDDLVFAAGVVHIVNKNGHISIATDPKTCILKIEIEQATTVAGGSGRFAGATGSFTGKVVGSGLLARKTDGSCNMRKPPMSEVDTVTGAGTLTF